MASLTQMRNRIEYNRPHLEVASGDIASFTTNMRSPLKELKVHFYCQQSGSGTPSPTNIRPLSGWSGLDIYDNQKNLLEITPETAIIFSSAYGNCTVNGDGSITLYGAAWVMFPVPVKPNTTYTYSGVTSKKANDLLWRILGGYTEKPTAIAAPYNWVVNDGAKYWSSATFTTDADTKWILVGVYCNAQYVSDGNQTISNMQIELGSTATAYEEFVGTKNSVLFPTSAGTVYGGYIDAVRGKLVVTWYGFVLDGVNYYVRASVRKETSGLWTGYWSAYDYIGIAAGGNNNPLRLLPKPDPSIPANVRGYYLVDRYEVNTPVSGIGGIQCVGGTGPFVRVFFDESVLADVSTTENTLTSMRAYLEENPIQIVYPIAEPIEYDIDPITIKTLRGANNIWSNANGEVEVQYWTH